MAIAAISKVSPMSVSANDSASHLRSDLSDFQSALTTGNLQAVTDALTRIKEDLRGPANSNGVETTASENPQDTVSKDVQALQQAFDAEDLAAVKAAFAKLQKDTQQIAKAQQGSGTKAEEEVASLPDSKILAVKDTGNLVDVYA